MSESSFRSLLHRQRYIETLSPAARQLEQRDIDSQASALEVELRKEQEKADQLERDASRYRFLRAVRKAGDHLDTRMGWIHVCRSGRFTGEVITLDRCDELVDEGMMAQAQHFGEICHGQEVQS